MSASDTPPDGGEPPLGQTAALLALDAVGRASRTEDCASAAFLGDLTVVQSMVELGINIDGADANGYTALQLAAAADRAPVVAFLLRSGADVRARGWAWLPWMVLDSYEPWEVALARRVHVEFCRKFDTL